MWEVVPSGQDMLLATRALWKNPRRSERIGEGVSLPPPPPPGSDAEVEAEGEQKRAELLAGEVGVMAGTLWSGML